MSTILNNTGNKSGVARSHEAAARSEAKRRLVEIFSEVHGSSEMNDKDPDAKRPRGRADAEASQEEQRSGPTARPFISRETSHKPKQQAAMSGIAAVTGANRGLGLEICRQLSAGGNFAKVYALCRGGSDALRALVADSSSKVVMVENVDVSKDEVGAVLKEAFGDTKVDLLVNNAGAYGTNPGGHSDVSSFMASQSLDNISMQEMRFGFELNTLGPLRVTRALLPNMVQPRGKVIIISTLMGSIADNTSGGAYSYRASKAAVNMVGKSLAMDLKDKGIAVGMVHPGMVETGFAGDLTENIPGVHDVESSTKGVLDAIESITLDNTGAFVHGNYGEGPKPCPW